MENVSVAEFEKVILGNRKAWLIDVREEFEFRDGHLAGAILVPTSRFSREFEKLKIKKNEVVAIYCRSGHRSLNVAQFLEGQGYEKIYNLSGGIIDWMIQGKEIIK